MAEYSVSEYTRRHRVHVVADRMTVAHVLAFAEKLRETGAPPREQVGFSRSEQYHLTGLDVSWPETKEP